MAQALALALLASPAAATVDIDWVPIVNPRNPADSQVMTDGTSGYGAVNYAYYISKYETSNAEYALFLNSVAGADPNGLYPGGGPIVRSGSPGFFSYSVTPGFENKPVTGLTFWQAARFANWIENAQPFGPQGPSTTEGGAYTITPAGVAANSIVRNPGATHFVASENEWYKAAYYSSGGTYFDYPAGTNAPISCALPSTEGNSASCDGEPLADVGAYQFSSSPYGTFDQGGNSFEWTDTIHQHPSGLHRVRRGGDADGPQADLAASARQGALASSGSGGIRLVEVPPVVPSMGPPGRLWLFIVVAAIAAGATRLYRPARRA